MKKKAMNETERQRAERHETSFMRTHTHTQRTGAITPHTLPITLLAHSSVKPKEAVHRARHHSLF